MNLKTSLKGWAVLLMTLTISLGSILPARAQSDVKVSGTVYDDALQQAFPGVTVIVAGTTNGTYTNGEGHFTISAPVGATLHFSFIGYKTYEYKVEKSVSDLKITLREDAQALDELVVLGYGVNARKQDLSASVGVIDNTEELATRPVTSATSMLQGQLAGVTVSNNGGDPTGMPNIVIRGQGSQNGDNVLWVVDGIPGAPINSINDIETITVLKDAASAAIYGAQSGAGGVILVTTKKGKKGEPSLSYDGSYGFSQAYNLPKPLTAEEQVRMRQLSYANAGIALPNSWSVEKNPWIGTTRTDWMKEIFRLAPYQRHNVALNVGGDKSSNRLSFSYEDNNGILINTYSKKYGVRYTGDFQLNKYITISEDLSWQYTTGRSSDTSSGYTGAILSAMYMPSSAEVYNPIDGTYAGTTTEDPAYVAKYGSNFADAHGDVVNPVRLLTHENLFNKYSDLWTTTTLKVGNFIEGLDFTSRFTYSLGNSYYKMFRPMTDEPGKPNESNVLVESATQDNSWKTENTLNYNRTFDNKHNLGLLASTTANHFVGRGLEGKSDSNFSDEVANLQYFKNTKDTSASDWLSGPDANMSIIGRISYSYDDRYFATASWRRDYAGRLPEGKKYGDFPAATAAWKISQEDFFQKSDFISLLKIRASWGRIGNLGSIPMNYSSPTLSETFWDEGAIYGPETQEQYNTFYKFSRAINPELTWETSEQFDLGLDLSLFRERLALSIDYFDKRTFNLIQQQTMNWPSTIGLDPKLINQGEVSNRGVEVEASWRDHISDKFSYFVSANFSYLHNEVTNIGVKNEDGTPGVWFNGNSGFRNIPPMMQTAEGQPLGSFWLYRTDGIFQTDADAAAYTKDGERIQPNAVAGDLKFVDKNGDGKLTDEDREYMGSAMPDFTFASTLGFTYGDFSCSMMLQGVAGAKALHVAKYMTMSDVEGSFNRDRRIMDAWTPENSSSKTPRLSKTDPNGNFSRPSDYYLEDASYLRLKNITISYDLTNLVRRWDHLSDRQSSLSCFFSGENLLTLTKYTGMDPEVGGWDAMTYPVSRIFSFGVKISY